MEDKTVYVVPLSGGKDSTFTLVKTLFKHDNVIALFNDTGWEHPVTYEYLNYLEDKLSIKIQRTMGCKRAEDLISLIRDMRQWPTGIKRFCTMYLKQYALKDWFIENHIDSGKEFIFQFGLRQKESNQRMKKYGGITPDELHDPDEIFPSRYNKRMRDMIKIQLPIVDLTTEEVFNGLKSFGIKYNPLYDEGTNDRVGCYPCLLAGKKVQKKIFETEEGKRRLEIIKKLEEEIGEKYPQFETGQTCSICSM